jgi:transposase
MAQRSSVPRYQLFVGVDIAATTFTVSWLRADGAPSAAQTFPQTPAGFTAVQHLLQTTGVTPATTRVVLEATRSYWVALAVALHQAGDAVSLVNPAKVHNYAKSLPRRGKSDPLDAQLLAQFAAERQPDLWTPPPTIYHELRQRLVARDGLLEMPGTPRVQARNQRPALQQWPVVVPAVQQQIEHLIAEVAAQIALLDAAIARVLVDSAWAVSAERLHSIPGIGLLTAAWILVATVNFSTCASAEAAVCYAGLNPLPRDSGSSIRGRPQIGHGGNGRLRTALYMATLSAAQHHPVIKTFYTRLRAAGKPMKGARCAAARKLLHLAFAVVTKEQRFDPAYQKLPCSTASKLRRAA